MKLLDYGYQNLRANILKKKGTVVKKIKLDKADSEIVGIVLPDDLSVLENVEEKGIKYEFEVVLDKIKLPIKVGDDVGKIIVYANNKKVKESYLTVNKDVKSLSFFELLKNELFDLISGEF